MNEPDRWLDSPGLLSADERRVLEAGLEGEVPQGAKAAVKGALLAQLPPSAPPPPPETLASPNAAATEYGVSTVGSATLGAFLKSTGIGFALTMAGTASWVTLQRSEAVDGGDTGTGAPTAVVSVPRPGRTGPVGTSSVAAPRTSNEPRSAHHDQDVARLLPREVTVRQGDTVGEPSPVQAPSVSTFPEALSRPETAGSESSRLAQARALLRSKDASAAFLALENLRRDHPRGLLVQEREVLTIEALVAMGREEVARAQAQDFLKRHPKSPHAASALRVLERRSAPP